MPFLDTTDDTVAAATLLSSKQKLLDLRCESGSPAVHRNIHNALLKIDIRLLELNELDCQERVRKVTALSSRLVPDVISVYHCTAVNGVKALVVVLTDTHSENLPREDILQIQREAQPEEQVLFTTASTTVGMGLLTGRIASC